MNKSLYDVLEVSRSAGDEALHAAFVRLSRQDHPDPDSPNPHEAAEMPYRLVRDAYRTLSHPDRRRKCDAMLAHNEAPIARAAPVTCLEDQSNNYENRRR